MFEFRCLSIVLRPLCLSVRLSSAHSGGVKRVVVVARAGMMRF